MQPDAGKDLPSGKANDILVLLNPIQGCPSESEGSIRQQVRWNSGTVPPAVTVRTPTPVQPARQVIKWPGE